MSRLSLSARLISYLGLHSGLRARISLNTEAIKPENIWYLDWSLKMWKGLQLNMKELTSLNSRLLTSVLAAHLDWSLPKCDPSSSVWGRVLWLVNGHNEGLWLVNTNSPARSLRKEEGGCGANNGAQAEYEQRQHGGVASLGRQGVKITVSWRTRGWFRVGQNANCIKKIADHYVEWLNLIW